MMKKKTKNKKMTSRFARPSFTFNNPSRIFYLKTTFLPLWIQTEVLSGLLTADILSTLDLLDARSAIIPTAIDAS